MKVVVITGIAQGLGKSLALFFAHKGYGVGGIDIDQEKIQRLTQYFLENKFPCCFIQADISHKEKCSQAVNLIADHFGKIDVLINNAGITYISPFLTSSLESLEHVIQINLLGSIYSTYAALPYLISQKGTISFVSSVAGFAPVYGRTAYCTSKYGMEGFAQTLRTELHSKGVHVSIISPSSIKTNIRKRKNKSNPFNDNENKTIGNALNPDEVAKDIYQHIRRKERRLLVGSFAYFSFWINKIFPFLYEKLMLQFAKKNVDESS